jgi:predicted DNA-binding transcriptional regulator YafY
MDILRHERDIEVVEPQSLRKQVSAELRAALDRYGK